MQKTIKIATSKQNVLVDIARQVAEVVSLSRIETGK